MIKKNRGIEYDKKYPEVTKCNRKGGGRVSKKYKPIDNKRERNLSFIMVKYG